MPSGSVTGSDLPCPESVDGGLLGQILAADGEFVHLLPADILDQRQILRCLAHRLIHIRQSAVVARVGPRSRPARGQRADLACASANAGFWVSGCESELPLAKRDTVSTPAEMKTSPSPALIA